MTSTLPTTWRPLTLRVWPWKLRISSPVWKYTKWKKKTLKEQLEHGLMVLGNTNSSCLQDFAYMETHLFLFLKLFSTTLAMTYAQIMSLHVHVSGSTIQDIIHDLQWNTNKSKGLIQYYRNHLSPDPGVQSRKFLFDMMATQHTCIHKTVMLWWLKVRIRRPVWVNWKKKKSITNEKKHFTRNLVF